MTKVSLVVALSFIFLRLCCAQDTDVPEAGYLSLGRYTNAFFGFSLPLPPDPALRIAQVSTSGMWRRLFGLAGGKGHTVFVISAQQMFTKDAERLMRAAPPTVIHGKEFSKGISHKKGPEGTIWKAMYLTVTNNYLLEFEISSLDPSIAEDLERCVEETTFFDPAKAKEIAAPDGRPYNPGLSQGPKK